MDELITHLDALQLPMTDSSADRAEKAVRRRQLAGRLCEALDGSGVDATTSHAAAPVLMGVQTGGTAFVERAQQLARLSWEAGNREGGALYARATDLLCNLNGNPQKYGTLVHVRHGEKVPQPVDDATTDDERAELGVQPLASLRQAIARDNRRAAERLGQTTGLPPGAEARRVWRNDDAAELLRRRDAAGGSVWREGEELVFVWESDADEVSLTASLQMPLWRLDGSDVWVLRVRIRDLDRAIISHGFLGTADGTTRVLGLGGDGCWRGDEASPAPAASSPLAGTIIETELPGPDGNTPRTVTVYRPPDLKTGVACPVVYLADGGMAPALAAVLEAAILDGRVAPTLLVGVASGRQDGADIRADEYIPGRHHERFECHRGFFVETVATWAEHEYGASQDRRAIRQSLRVKYSIGGIPPEHAEEAAVLTQRLQDEGWAPHVEVGQLFQEWGQLAVTVDAYELTIDDYTNDLTARDAITLVLSWCSEQFGTWAKPLVDEADQRFTHRTAPDEEAVLGRYFRIGEDAGWWWRRRPVSGPLGDYLDGA